MKSMIAVAAASLALVPSAVAATSHIHVAPEKVKAGKSVAIYGSVGSGCHQGSQVTLISKAFKGATRSRFAGVPAVLTKVGKFGLYAVSVRVSSAAGKGSFTVTGRCGGGNFGSAPLKVG
ncbi:MAG TPA: hypothetical protein VII01_14900 [Solirubrobacteraceae bacterium]|jgi:hypothetical protein